MVKDTYTTDEAADLLEVTPGRVRQMVRAGLLRAESFGRAHVIPASALKDAAKRKTKPGPLPKPKVEATNGQATKRATKKGKGKK
jgi:excisionase family DNA binding protein